jgi:hypothetical protein
MDPPQSTPALGKLSSEGIQYYNTYSAIDDSQYTDTL